MGPGVGSLRQGVQNFLGRVKVRKALGEVDGPVLVADAGHAADDGVREGLYPVAQCWHGNYLFF